MQHPTKTPLKSTPQLGSILDPTWPHFGRVLGAKMGPSWHQIAPKIDLQINQKNDHLSDGSWDRFSSILGPKMAPKRGSKLLFLVFFEALGAILGPRGPPDPPRPRKSPQDPPQEAPRTPPRGLLRPILGPKLMDLGPQVGRFVFDFWFNFDKWLVG